MRKYVLFAAAGVIAALLSWRYTARMTIGDDARVGAPETAVTTPAPSSAPASAAATDTRAVRQEGTSPGAFPGGDGGVPGTVARITGTITVAPEVAAKAGAYDTLFVIARRERGGPPVAVKKLTGFSFPLRYELGPENAMIGGAASFTGELEILARLDRDGSAGPAQPGDLEGAAPAPVRPGDTADIIIAITR